MMPVKPLNSSWVSFICAEDEAEKDNIIQKHNFLIQILKGYYTNRGKEQENSTFANSLV